jgi:hypothetical protein
MVIIEQKSFPRLIAHLPEVISRGNIAETHWPPKLPCYALP